MNKHLLNSIWVVAIAALFSFSITSCDKESITLNTTDEAAEYSVFALEQRGNLGKHGCYDLVFPVTIKFSDGTTKVITSQDSLKKGCKAWHENKGGIKPEKPSFVFPIQVIAEDGSVIQVDDAAELKSLREACRKTYLDSLHHGDSLFHHGFPKHDSLCFSIVFPIQIKKADGTILTIATKEDLKAAVKTEKGHGRGHGKKHGVMNQFELVFPLTVKKADGTTTTVNTKEALKALREDC